jgi:hypothetical protein
MLLLATVFALATMVLAGLLALLEREQTDATVGSIRAFRAPEQEPERRVPPR